MVPLCPLSQVRTAWLRGTELHGAEEAPGCRGLAEAEVPAVLEEEVGEVEEEEVEVGDLRGASSVAVEEVEEGGEDTFVPSPGKFTWDVTAASNGDKWTNQDIIYTDSMKQRQDDAVTGTYVLMFYVLYELCLENKGDSK